MKRLKQVLTIAVTAYTLYRVVSDFLETDAGQSVKAKVTEYTNPVVDKADEYYASAKAAVDKVTGKAEEVVEENI